jgi:hypothetical protein
VVPRAAVLEVLYETRGRTLETGSETVLEDVHKSKGFDGEGQQQHSSTV